MFCWQTYNCGGANDALVFHVTVSKAEILQEIVMADEPEFQLSFATRVNTLAPRGCRADSFLMQATGITEEA